MSVPEPEKKKHYFVSTRGRQYAAAGILPHDENGFWCAEEKKGLSDFGGKYQPEDGDILVTISREFGEEVYHTAEISVSKLQELQAHKKGVPIVIGKFDKPSYFALVVETKHLEISLNDSEVKKARKRYIQHNPSLSDPESVYQTISVVYVPFDNIIEFSDRFTWRLQTIIKRMGW